MSFQPVVTPAPVTNRSFANRIGDAFNAMQSVMFGPLTPPMPQPETQAEGVRAFQYLPGYNLQYIPRAAEKLTPFAWLINIADIYDTARMCIAHRVDEMVAMDWAIVNRDESKPASQSEISEAKARLERPDGVLRFAEWLAVAIEEVLVTDALSVYVNKSRGGDVLGLELIDGSTIRPLLDNHGRSPMPPTIAYQQVLFGRPWWEGTRDELIYSPKRRRSRSAYGRSPTEELILTINRALRRQTFDLSYFTDGNVPEAIIGAPPDMHVDDVKALQSWFDEVVAQPENRRRLHFVPSSTGRMTPYEFKKPPLDPAIEEFLDRRTMANYGVPPQALGMTNDVNRACYSEDTETLTEKGWKNYWEIVEGEKVATYNPATSELEYHQPTGFYLYDYTGEMINFKSAQVDVCVTPEHRMYVKPQWNGRATKPWQIQRAKDIDANQFGFIASAGWSGEEVAEFVLPAVEAGKGHDRRTIAERSIKMDDWLCFLGWIISEGCILDGGKVILSQTGCYVNLVEECLRKLPFAFAGYDSDDGTRRWQVSDKGLWMWLAENLGMKSHTKKLPTFVKQLSVRQQKIIYESMMCGDGTDDYRQNRNNWAYSTNSIQLAGDVQEMALKFGFRARVREATRAYSVEMSRGVPYNLRRKDNIKTVLYSGKVYCFEVPNHLFVTRRNGRVAIQGNTAGMQENVEFRKRLPYLRFFSGFFTDCLMLMGYPNVKHQFQGELPQEDEMSRGELETLLLGKGVYSMDHVLQLRGLPGIGSTKHYYYTATSAIPIPIDGDPSTSPPPPTAGQSNETNDVGDSTVTPESQRANENDDVDVERALKEIGQWKRWEKRKGLTAGRPFDFEVLTPQIARLLTSGADIDEVISIVRAGTLTIDELTSQFEAQLTALNNRLVAGHVAKESYSKSYLALIIEYRTQIVSMLYAQYGPMDVAATSVTPSYIPEAEKELGDLTATEANAEWNPENDADLLSSDAATDQTPNALAHKAAGKLRSKALKEKNGKEIEKELRSQAEAQAEIAEVEGAGKEIEGLVKKAEHKVKKVGIRLAVWKAEPDPCVDCEALDGKSWPVDEVPQFPGDGNTKCHENCQCTIDYKTLKEEDADKIERALEIIRYSPDQPRDEHGRFGGGGSSDSGAIDRGTGQRSALDRLKDTGGFTYKPADHNFVDVGKSKSFGVSPYPNREKVIEGKVTKDDINKYMKDNKDLLSKDGHYLGAWKDGDTGRTYLDVSIVTKSEGEAKSLSEKHNQLAYFDYNNGDSKYVKKAA